MRTNTFQNTSNGGDPAEQALMEEFSAYLALITKNATEPMVAAIHEHKEQLAECMKQIEDHRVRQTALISRWMTLMLVVLVVEGCVIAKLLMR